MATVTYGKKKKTDPETRAKLSIKLFVLKWFKVERGKGM
jgi:hypothetical protein